jgi:hypothetical protein
LFNSWGKKIQKIKKWIYEHTCEISKKI